MHVILITASPVCVTIGIPSQLSVAVGALVFGAGTSLAHSTVTSAGQVMPGGVLSVTVIVCVQELEFPQSSVAIKLRRMTTSCGQLPGMKPSIFSDIVTAVSQLSVAVAV